MITENIKSFTDEEIMSLINKIVMGEIEAELSDLKAILAEASGRKLEKNYINIIADKIKQKTNIRHLAGYLFNCESIDFADITSP